MNPDVNVQHPNKTFVVDYERYNEFVEGRIKNVVIIVADSKETAQNYLYDKLGIKADLIWLMGCNHPTLYDQTGNKPLNVQAKIMYNTVSKIM